MDDEGFGLQDLGRLLRRRASVVGLTFFGIVLSGIVIAYSLDNLYKASGVIVIDQREVSDKYLPGTYRDSNPELRIERIRDTVMNRQNLSDIVARYNMYADERGDGPLDSVVWQLRKNFELEFLVEEEDPRSKYTGDITGFVVSFYDAKPEIARNVARDIIELFLAGNRQRRQVAYLETATALERESDSLRVDVMSLEGQLAEFKSEHPGALPEDRIYNRQIVERKARDLDGLDREIRSLQDRKTMLQSQIAQTEPWVTAVGPSGETLPTSSERLKMLQSEYLQLLGNYNSDHPDVLRLKREIDSLSGGIADPAFRQTMEAELAAKQTELADARRSYGADHPDIRILERAVAALEKNIADMPETAASLPPPNNPVFLNLELQIQGVNNELRALRNNRAALQKESQELDRKIQVAPEVERRYLELARDVSLARQQYEDSKSRLMSVQRAGELQQQELAERFVVTRYPTLPFQPSFPNRPLFLIIGLFLGITLGIGVGLSREALDDTIRGTRDFKAILGMPPIVAIPQIYTADDLQTIRASRVTYFTTIGVIATVAMIYVLLQRSGAV